jgi:hypothetical protein
MSRKSNFQLYRVWDGIIQRCYNPNAKNYHNYGGRGIKMHDEWKNDFSSFEYYCLNNGWRHGLHIDRINNNDGYYPNNIQFVTVSKNMRNKRTNHLISYKGETKCAIEWCEVFNIKPSTLWRRLDSGWTIDEAFTKPIQRRKNGR